MKKTVGTFKSWMLAGIVISVLLIVAAWFLLISPVLAQASETRASTEDQEAQNDIAREEVAVLRADFARMDEYEAQLADLQEQITTTQRFADVQRMVSEVAESHDVTVNSLTFSTAEELAPPPPPAPVEPEAEGDADEETAAEDAVEEEPAPPPPPAFAGLYKIDVTMEFSGRYSDVLAVLNDLQVGENRIILVSGVTVEPDSGDTAEAQGADGAVVEVEGETFVLVDPEYIASLADPLAEFDPDAEPEEQEPLPRSEDNPLTPATD